MMFLWQRYTSALKTNPIRTNTATAMVVTFLGDAIAQTIEIDNNNNNNNDSDNKNTIDYERNVTVTTYWSLCATPTYFWFRWLDRTFPIPIHKSGGMVDVRILTALGRKLAVHLGVFAPTVNACFYGWLIFKGRLVPSPSKKKKKEDDSGGSYGGVDDGKRTITSEKNQTETETKTKTTFLREWNLKLRNDLLETQKKSVATWGCAQTFNFLFLPTHTRVLFNSVVSVFWTAYVSMIGHR